MEKFLALMIFFFWWNSQIYTRQRKNSNKIPIVLCKTQQKFSGKSTPTHAGEEFFCEKFYSKGIFCNDIHV